MYSSAWEDVLAVMSFVVLFTMVTNMLPAWCVITFDVKRNQYITSNYYVVNVIHSDVYERGR